MHMVREASAVYNDTLQIAKAVGNSVNEVYHNKNMCQFINNCNNFSRMAKDSALVLSPITQLIGSTYIYKNATYRQFFPIQI